MEASFSKRGIQASIAQSSAGINPQMQPQVQLQLNALETAIYLLHSDLFELSEKLKPVSRIAGLEKAQCELTAQVGCPLANSIFQIRCRIDRLTAGVREQIELLEI
jgi:hypothetical protein